MEGNDQIRELVKQNYRRIHFTEEWGPFQWADMPAL